MAQPLTAEDILPLVKHLSLEERTRLVRLISRAPEGDAAVYRLLPTKSDEFSSDHEPLAWDAEGWEHVE